MPKTFQRPVFMSFSPPFTEAYLQEEKGDTDEHADRITAVRSQIQADREIDQRTSKRIVSHNSSSSSFHKSAR